MWYGGKVGHHLTNLSIENATHTHMQHMHAHTHTHTPRLNITVGHRTLSDDQRKMSDNFLKYFSLKVCDNLLFFHLLKIIFKLIINYSFIDILSWQNIATVKITRRLSEWFVFISVCRCKDLPFLLNLILAK